MKTDSEIAARALPHRAEEAVVLAERIEAAATPSTHAVKAFRDEAAACLRVATQLAPEPPYNHHG